MFREKITRRYQSLSPSFKKIGEFILTSHQRVAFMSASRLASHLGLDVATVTRFAQQIGYEGYVQLRREIQEQVLEEIRQTRAQVKDRLESAEDRVSQVFWQDWINLEKTIKNISIDEFNEAIAAIGAARRIYLVSEGVGAGLAQVMASYLRMSKDRVVVLNQGAFDQALVLGGMGAEDLLIAIGFTNYAFAATRAVQLARKVGAKTIGVIAQADCPIGQEADILFSCSAAEEGYLPSPTGVGAILFALAYSFMTADAEQYNHDLIRFQEIYADLTEGTARGEDDVLTDLIGRF